MFKLIPAEKLVVKIPKRSANLFSWMSKQQSF